MRQTSITGPVTGRSSPAIHTGQTWNGAPVLAFRQADLLRLIIAGDARDANGEGLVILDGTPHDVTGGNAEPVPALRADVDGQAVTLYVPEAGIWDETTPNSTVTAVGYDEDNRCRACGEHIADPHAPECPAAVAAALRATAEADEEAHASTLAVGGYTSGASPVITEGDEPAEASHRFLAAAARLAADLIEMDHTGAFNLHTWPATAEFVAYVTGEADQWTA